MQRGRGIGQELVRELLRICREEFGFQEMELNVYDWNLPAIHCYEKAGFVRNHGKSSSFSIGNETWQSINMTLTIRGQLQGQ
jgi:RimJ/RimL family protein N-acetyltransferase